MAYYYATYDWSSLEIGAYWLIGGVFVISIIGGLINTFYDDLDK